MIISIWIISVMLVITVQFFGVLGMWAGYSQNDDTVLNTGSSILIIGLILDILLESVNPF